MNQIPISFTSEARRSLSPFLFFSFDIQINFGFGYKVFSHMARVDRPKWFVNLTCFLNTLFLPHIHLTRCPNCKAGITSTYIRGPRRLFSKLGYYCRNCKSVYTIDNKVGFFNLCFIS